VSEAEVEDPRHGLRLAALGTGLVLTAVLAARLPSWRSELGTFQALFVVAFAFYALAVKVAARLEPTRVGILTVLLVAVATRVALLPVSPTLSDDLYRYVWEGRVVTHGGNPYRSGPLAPALERLRDRELFPRVNHPELASVYPPLAMAGFALVARVSPTVWAMKLWVILHDLALVACVLAWARPGRTSLGAALAYAWNPLVLVEYAGTGHNDPTAMLWLVLALIWAERSPIASAMALAVGVLVKLAPLAALPFLLRRWPWRARLTSLLMLGVGLGGYWLATRGPDSGLSAYWRTWLNNELAFHYLAAWTGRPDIARLLALGVATAVAVMAWTAAWDATRAARALLRTGVLVSPVAHPWYFGWVLVLEPLTGGVRASFAPWALLSATCILSYGLFAPPREGGAYHLPLAWRWLEYGAPLALAAGIARFARASQRTGDGVSARREDG
jgi:hypothetical protein